MKVWTGCGLLRAVHPLWLSIHLLLHARTEEYVQGAVVTGAGSLQASLCQGSNMWPLGIWEMRPELGKDGKFGETWQTEDRRNNFQC